MLTFIWVKSLHDCHGLVISYNELNFDLVGSVIVTYKAAKVTEGPFDPCAAGYHGPFLTTVPEDRKHNMINESVSVKR